jgi:hypothetical protein
MCSLERNALRSAPVVRLIAQATTVVDLVSVTAVNGVLHALASPTIEQANVA